MLVQQEFNYACVFNILLNLIKIVKINLVAYDLHCTYYKIFLELIIIEKKCHNGLRDELLFVKIIFIIIVFFDTIPDRVYVYFKYYRNRIA